MAQVQNKYPKQHQANPDDVFGRFAPYSIHLGIILSALSKFVMKQKYQKSIIFTLGPPTGSVEDSKSPSR
jgi:hypothetical protein